MAQNSSYEQTSRQAERDAQEGVKSDTSKLSNEAAINYQNALAHQQKQNGGR